MWERRTLIALCVLAGAGLAGVASVRPGWQAYKSWRSHQLMKESQRFLDERSPEVALQKAQAAALLNRDDPAVLRHYARLATREEQPLALALWQRLLALPQPSAADFAEALVLATRGQEFELAFSWLDVWSRESPEPSVAWASARAQLLAATGDRDAFHDHLAAWRRSGPGPVPTDVQLLECQLQLTYGENGERQPTLQRLLDLGAGDDAVALQALLTCLGGSDVPPAIRRTAAERTLRHPAATAAHLVLARVAQIKSGEPVEAELNPLLNRLVAEPDSRERTGALVALLSNQLADRLLPHLSPGRSRSDAGLLAVYLEACLQTARFDDVLEFIGNSNDLPISPAVGLVYRARAHGGLGHQAKAADSLRRAIEAADDDDLALVERTVAEAGDARLALDYYERLTDHPRYGAIARAGALGPAYALKDEATIRRLLPHIDLVAARSAPKYLRHAIYLLLLEEVRTDEALRAAETMFNDRAGDASARLLLAFANSRMGRDDVARRLLDPIEPATLTDTPSRLIFRWIGGDRAAEVVLPAPADLLTAENRLLVAASDVSPLS